MPGNSGWETDLLLWLLKYQHKCGIGVWSNLTFRNSRIENSQGDIKSLSVHFEPAIEDPILFDRKLNKIEIDKIVLEKYVDDYQLTSDIIVNTYIKNDVFYVFVPGQPEYELYPIAVDKFAFKILDGYKLEFKIDNKGKVVEVLFIQPNGIFKAKKK